MLKILGHSYYFSAKNTRAQLFSANAQFSFGSYCVKHGSVLAANVIVCIFFFSDSQRKSASNISLPSLSKRYFILSKTPSQETCCANMLQLFKDIYPRTCGIIDCSEIFIEHPCSYRARAQTYSNYKKHNTVKFLIGITPCDAISYIFQCWGGRATDKCITMNSDFLRLLEYGDVVLADRGFDIADDIALHGATLFIPSFTRGKKQLSLQDVECSQKIAKIHIHVERVIGLLKKKYTIFQGTLPVTFLKRKYDTDIAFIDKVLFVCSALVNLSPTIVPH